MTANRSAFGELGALNDAITFTEQRTNNAVVWEIDTGTLAGTVAFEATLDDSNWFSVEAIRLDGTIITTTSSFSDRGHFISTAFSQMRLRVSAYTSGTSNARMEASSGLDVLRADVARVIPGTGASSLGKAEDAAHSSGDVGVMSLGVRTDVPGATAADGDYTPLLTSGEGGLWVENLPGKVDSGNSRTATLLADAVFTGTGIDILEHQSITVILDASHDSATDGMQFEFSSDNTNWDYTFDFTYIAADGGRVFQFGAFAQYFRIVYTNGGTGQTHFRVQTLLHHGTTLTTIHRLVDSAHPDRSAEITKSVVIAQAAGSGDFVPVQATAAGNFKMSLEEVDGAIAGGGTESAALRVTMANDSTGQVGISGTRTSGGTTLYKNIDVDESEDAVKASAGQLYWVHAMNLSASVLFLKFYNDTVGNIEVGTDVPDLTFPIPTQGDTNGAGFVLAIPNGIEFDTAITIACTTGIADADDGAPAANVCVVNLGFA